MPPSHQVLNTQESRADGESKGLGLPHTTTDTALEDYATLHVTLVGFWDLSLPGLLLRDLLHKPEKCEVLQ